MDSDAQRKLASLALLAIAVLGPTLVVMSGRTQQRLVFPAGALGSLSRNRGSLGSVGSIGAPGAVCKRCSHVTRPLPYLFHCLVTKRSANSSCGLLGESPERLCARRFHRFVLQHRCVPASEQVAVCAHYVACIVFASACQCGAEVGQQQGQMLHDTRRLCGKRLLHSQRGLCLFHRQHLWPGDRPRGVERTEPGRVRGAACCLRQPASISHRHFAPACVSTVQCLLLRHMLMSWLPPIPCNSKFQALMSVVVQVPHQRLRRTAIRPGAGGSRRAAQERSLPLTSSGLRYMYVSEHFDWHGVARAAREAMSGF